MFLAWGGLLVGVHYNQAWVCNLKRKPEFEKHKIVCSFFFHKLMFIERAGGKLRENGAVKGTGEVASALCGCFLIKLVWFQNQKLIIPIFSPEMGSLPGPWWFPLTLQQWAGKIWVMTPREWIKQEKIELYYPLPNLETNRWKHKLGFKT